jgi:hypothetical protein
MRLVFGDARIVMHGGSPSLQFTGLESPATILPSTEGAAVPDLTPYVGQVLSFTGVLDAPGINLEVPYLHWSEFRPILGEAQPGPAIALVSGNMGRNTNDQNKAVGPSLSGKTLSGSLAFHQREKLTSWIRVTALPDQGISIFFADLEPGARVIIAGNLESSTYNEKPRMQIALRSFQHLGPTGAGVPAAIASSFAHSETAEQAIDAATF